MSGQAMARVLAPLARGVRNMIARAVVRLVDDAPKMQTLQIDVTAGETLDAVEHWHPYGFTAHPQPGAEALLVCLAGSRAKPVVVACADRRYRLTGLAGGEVAIHDDQGQTVILRRDGVEITAPRVLIDAPDVEVTGTLTVRQGVAVSGAGPSGKAMMVTGASTLEGPADVMGGITASGGMYAGGGITAAGALTGAGVSSSGPISGAGLTMEGRPLLADQTGYLYLG